MRVTYTPKIYQLPPEGMYRGQLTTIEELGPTMTPNGEKDRVRFIWTLEEKDEEGNPFRVFESFNLSIHPKSLLSKTIFEITGKSPGQEFELNDLVGSELNLVLQHNTNEFDGRTYCNIAARLRPSTAAETAEAKRVTTAVAKVNAQATTTTDPNTITDEDIPF